MAELLVTNGAKVNIADNHGHAALWYANHAANTEIIELLRKHGARE